MRGLGYPDPVAWVRRMQREQLFGTPDARFASYSGVRNLSGFGALVAPYDLSQPGRVAEVKRTLFALAKAGADPFKKPVADVVTETTWHGVTDDDTWDPAAEDEMVLALSRLRGLGWQVPEPYVQAGPGPGAGPQPAVNALELLAGAANEKLGGAVKMKLYETWRKGGCAFEATCFDPPSAISRPASETAVGLTQETGVRLALPASAPAAMHSLVGVHDAQLQALWQNALKAETEAERLAYAEALRGARQARNQLVTALLAEVPSPQGTSETPEQTCAAIGGTWQPATQLCRLPLPVTPGPPKPPPPKAESLGAKELAIAALAIAGIWWWASSTPSGKSKRR